MVPFSWGSGHVNRSPSTGAEGETDGAGNSEETVSSFAAEEEEMIDLETVFPKESGGATGAGAGSAEGAAVLGESEQSREDVRIFYDTVEAGSEMHEESERGSGAE